MKSVAPRREEGNNFHEQMSAPKPNRHSGNTDLNPCLEPLTPIPKDPALHSSRQSLYGLCCTVFAQHSLWLTFRRQECLSIPQQLGALFQLLILRIPYDLRRIERLEFHQACHRLTFNKDPASVLLPGRLVLARRKTSETPRLYIAPVTKRARRIW